jgi:hypothetical protein
MLVDGRKKHPRIGLKGFERDIFMAFFQIYPHTQNDDVSIQHPQ